MLYVIVKRYISVACIKSRYVGLGTYMYVVIMYLHMYCIHMHYIHVCSKPQTPNT